ncbi:TorD/DmsD family molecular chaperone [Desulfosporosinus shakirovi]|uniref:TorD/DmsD family molecular chaperone n=1 Tax=Desulfosporosinus shakirovi TaxID=2885154 RepID=UPI001E4D3BBD|nr:molecular chaperone TorD family protein [Desulfosporosinus sp. SRJS8]MCB8818239.1 molecular chaperone TorD family protein [Desulfosporosinus sp. SRJS8]
MSTNSDNRAMGENLRALIEVRIHAYDLLRRNFWQEPSPEFLQSLIQTEQMTSFPFSDESSLIAEGAKDVTSYLNELKPLRDETFDQLHWDYTRLFIGPNKLAAPPWESAYLNEDRLLFQEETLQVRRAYLKYNFLPKDYGHEADDHLGLELDFMYQLGLLSLDALNSENCEDVTAIHRDQREFLKGHLLKWINQFSQTVIQSANTDFYKGMAKILSGFLSLDLKALEELSAIEI